MCGLNEFSYVNHLEASLAQKRSVNVRALEEWEKREGCTWQRESHGQRGVEKPGALWK